MPRAATAFPLVRPMLATLVPAAFDAPGWVYEEKYDGVRALAYRRGGRVRLYSRNDLDLTDEFPAIAADLAELPGGNWILDGEIVALDRRGISRFQLLQRRSDGRTARPRFAIFDCLEHEGRLLLARPLAERRRALEALVPARSGRLLRARRLPQSGLASYRIAQERGWEGIVAKDAASVYEPGRRTRSWLKVKTRRESEFVIGGFTPPAGGRRHFGALLLGLFDGAALRYVGKVGAGFSHDALATLHARMRALVTGACPFAPPRPRGHATWVRPRLVAQVAFHEWTADGRLRQPVFLGLRRDKAARACTWETRER